MHRKSDKQVFAPRELLHQLRKSDSLKYFFRNGKLSRAELSRYLSTSQTVAAKIVNDLLNEGWCVECEYVYTGRRPAKLLRLNTQGSWFLGLSTNEQNGGIWLVAFDFENNILWEKEEFCEDCSSGEAAIKWLKKAVLDFRGEVGKRFPCRRLLACAGIIGCIKTSDNQIMQASFNISNCNLDKELTNLLGVSSVVEDIPVAMIMREYWSSMYNAAESYLYINALPFVHSALLLDGKIIRGKNGLAGRLGLMVFADAKHCLRPLFDLIDRDVMQLSEVGYTSAWKNPENFYKSTACFMYPEVLIPRIPDFSEALVLGVNAMLAAFAPHQVVIGGIPDFCHQEFQDSFAASCAKMPSESPIVNQKFRIIHTSKQTYVEAMKSEIFSLVSENYHQSFNN